MRPNPTVPLLLALSVLVCACGDDPTDAASKGARVRILTSAVDGPVVGTIQLQSMDDVDAPLYTAAPLDGDPAVFVAPDAPPGRYYISSSEGWGMLWGGTGGSTGSPLLRGADYPAATVRIGKPRSLYVAAKNPSTEHGHVGNEWAGEWKVSQEGGRQAFQPADVKIVPQGEGLVAIHFTPEVWKAGHAIRAAGRMSSGAVTPLIAFQLTDPKTEARPRIAFTHAAPEATLSVHLVPPPGLERVPDGTPVTVTLLDVPLNVTYEAASHAGEARFDSIGSQGHGLRVALPASGPDAAFVMDQETWRLHGALFAVALDPASSVRKRLDVGSHEVVEVRVRYEGGDRYALLPAAVDPDAPSEAVLVVRTAPGPQDLLLRLADGRWLETSFTATAGDASVHAVAGEPQAPARIRGTVNGGGRGFRVRFTRIDGTEEEPRHTTGAGLSAAVDPYGVYEASVPAGTYEVQVIRPGGVLTRPRTLPMKAGRDIRLDLPAR